MFEKIVQYIDNIIVIKQKLKNFSCNLNFAIFEDTFCHLKKIKFVTVEKFTKFS